MAGLLYGVFFLCMKTYFQPPPQLLLVSVDEAGGVVAAGWVDSVDWVGGVVCVSVAGVEDEPLVQLDPVDVDGVVVAGSGVVLAAGVVGVVTLEPDDVPGDVAAGDDDDAFQFVSVDVDGGVEVEGVAAGVGVYTGVEAGSLVYAGAGAGVNVDGVDVLY